MPPPWVPGMDAAGTVESVGAGVERLAVGDEVMAAVTPRRPEGGAQAELLVVPAASVVPIPAGATLEQAATLPMNGLTALRGLELLDLEPGATLAVTGGAGLLASYVIPIAKLRGLRVLADAGPADEELVRGFGADVVLPRGDELREAMLAAAPGGVDAVFDTARARTRHLPAIRAGGGARLRQDAGTATTSRTASTIHPVSVGDVLERTDWLHELSDLAARGVLDAARRRDVPARAGAPTRTGRWRPAACAAAPSSSSTEEDVVKKNAPQQTGSPSELIDARIRELDDWRGEMLARLRALIKQADPEVVEEWKWRGVPVWEHDGIICTGETYKSVVKTTFAKGASLEDPSGLFNSSLEGNVRRAIDFHEGEKIDEKAFIALVRAAVALNTSRSA